MFGFVLLFVFLSFASFLDEVFVRALGDGGEKEKGVPHSVSRTPYGFAEGCRMGTGKPVI